MLRLSLLCGMYLIAGTTVAHTQPTKLPTPMDGPLGMKFVPLLKGTTYLGWNGTKGSVMKSEKENFEIAIHTLTPGNFWQWCNYPGKTGIQIRGNSCIRQGEFCRSGFDSPVNSDDRLHSVGFHPVRGAVKVQSADPGPKEGTPATALAGKRVVFLGDSNTQAGGYVNFTTYYLEKIHPHKDFDILSLGLASETLSGLSENGHAGGKFPRPSLFERLDRVLEKAKPEVVFACYGMNDGIYLPLDMDRTTAFQKGVSKLIAKCQKAGAKHIYLITPPIYDFTPKKGEFNYDAVLTEYAKWEMGLKIDGVTVIDLHTAMRKAREGRATPFSGDKVHPGDDGHLLMARTILAALGAKVPDEKLTDIKADPLFKLAAQKRALRSAAWMKHIGYTREKTVQPGPLGTIEADTAKLQEQIDAMRRKK